MGLYTCGLEESPPKNIRCQYCPIPGIEGVLPGSSQALGLQHPHPAPAFYSPDPSCLANLQPCAPSSREGLQQSQGAGGQLVRGLIRDLGTPEGREARRQALGLAGAGAACHEAGGGERQGGEAEPAHLNSARNQGSACKFLIAEH
uniref:Uncharacterized protein n=1 Tax=Molossus molossus TaxID=27622 RepID=A0A7J8FA78_MOLMO|nr:hypothetical protein HJG59_008587 [Molossus molossus]